MKFRVYDNVDKKYVGTGISNNLFVITQSGLLFEYNLKGTFKEAYPDRYTVEFSTGLKDKNGVQIYEGDIIKDEYSQINPIKFHYGSFWFNWLEMPYYLEQIEKGEIIGNIHGGNDDK